MRSDSRGSVELGSGKQSTTWRKTEPSIAKERRGRARRCRGDPNSGDGHLGRRGDARIRVFGEERAMNFDTWNEPLIYFNGSNAKIYMLQM